MEIKTIDVSLDNAEGDIASYLVYTDRYNILIETGPSSSVKKIYQFLEDEGISPSDINYIIITHIHIDHMGAVGHIVNKNRSVKVYVHPRGFPNLIDPSKLWSVSKEVLGGLARLYGPPTPVSRKNLIRVRDGEEMDVGEDTVVFIYTPGHTSQHMCILFNEHSSLFIGDAAGIYHEDTVIPSTPKPYNPEKALESLIKLINIPVRRVYFTHFGWYEPGKDILIKAKEKLFLWKRIFKSFYENGFDIDKSLSELLYVDDDVKIMNEYFIRRGYGEDELKISVYGFLSYFQWISGS